MPFYVYLIVSDEGHHYTGHTPDLQRRLAEHNGGMSHATKHGRNWRIIHTETYLTRSDAMKREKWLKSGMGRQRIKDNIVGCLPASIELVRQAGSPPKAE